MPITTLSTPSSAPRSMRAFMPGISASQPSRPKLQQNKSVARDGQGRGRRQVGQDARLGMCLAGQQQRLPDPGQARLGRTQPLCDMCHFRGRLLPAAHCRRAPAEQQQPLQQLKRRNHASCSPLGRGVLVGKEGLEHLAPRQPALHGTGGPATSAGGASSTPAGCGSPSSPAMLIWLRVACLRAAQTAIKHHLPNMHSLPSWPGSCHPRATQCNAIDLMPALPHLSRMRSFS